MTLPDGVEYQSNAARSKSIHKGYKTLGSTYSTPSGLVLYLLNSILFTLNPFRILKKNSIPTNVLTLPGGTYFGCQSGSVLLLKPIISLLFLRLKVNAQGVHAITLPCFSWPIVEDVAQMASAAGAYDLGTDHAEGGIANLFNPVARTEFGIKARPAAVRIEFLRIVEELIAAARTGIHAFFEMHVVFARKGPLGAFFSQHMVLIGWKLLLPFFLAFMKGILHWFDRFYNCFEAPY
jgi:hypothetical protein